MMKIEAKPVTRGVAEGEAIISHMPISFMMGIDPDTGIIREPGHELEGQSVAGKILVFPMAKGSATGAWRYYIAFKRGNAPKGIINIKAEAAAAVSAVITETPMVHEPKDDPLEWIDNGDYVIINADQGFIEIEKKQK